MRSIVIIFCFSLIGSAYCGILTGLATYGACQSACNAAWVACCAGLGVTAGTVTLGAGAPAAVVGCSVAQGACMAVCASAFLLPTP